PTSSRARKEKGNGPRSGPARSVWPACAGRPGPPMGTAPRHVRMIGAVAGSYLRAPWVLPGSVPSAAPEARAWPEPTPAAAERLERGRHGPGVSARGARDGQPATPADLDEADPQHGLEGRLGDRGMPHRVHGPDPEPIQALPPRLVDDRLQETPKQAAPAVGGKRDAV